MSSQTPVTITEAAERIRRSEIIAIVIANYSHMASLGSAYALREGLKSLGKSVTLFAPDREENHLALPWRIASDGEEPLREFVISFDLSKSPIKELRYEKADNRLDVILSPTASRIRREDIDFRYGPLRYDLVITVGVPSLDEAASSIRRVPELLHEKPILNIDAARENKRYGELNLFPAPPEELGSIPELVFTLLESLGADLANPETATALLSSIVAASEQFHPLKTGPRTLRIAADLIEKGASMASVHETLRLTSAPEEKLNQLMGRALARSRFDEHAKAIWLALTYDDFIKTNTNPGDATKVLARVLAITPESKIGLLLYQENTADIRISVASSDTLLAPRLEKQLGAIPGSSATLAEHWGSFREADEAAKRLLENLNEVK